MTDIPPQAIAAAEADMLRRFPKADLHAPGTGFRWSDFLPALEAAAPHLAAAERAKLQPELNRIEHDAIARYEDFAKAQHATVAEAVAAERERIVGAVRELLAAAMDYFNEMGACVAHPPDEWASEARYAQAEAAITSLLRQGREGGSDE